jgi:hypothetical protein
MIIIEGNGWGNNYRGFEGPWDKNMVLSFHKYWNPNTQDALKGMLAHREKFNMPVWLGETGENSNKWFTDCISLLEKNNIGWAWWPLKKINSAVCPLMVVAPAEYAEIVDYWNNNNAERPSRELATRVLFEIAGNLIAERCRFNKDVIDAMFRQRAESSALAFTSHCIPGRIHASDFDMGYPGIAYADADVENTGEEGKRAGNRGHMYRNDGTDIEVCKDSINHSNGFNIGYVEDSEWMMYTVNCDREGVYEVFARVAAPEAAGVIQLSLDRKTATAATGIGSTGDFQIWKTIPLGKVKLSVGMHVLKVIAEKGGFNLSYLEFR